MFVLNQGIRGAPPVLCDGIYSCTAMASVPTVIMSDTPDITHNIVPKSTRAKHEWRSGTVVKREIVKFSKSTHTIIPSTPFYRLVREITATLGKKVNFKKEAMDAIQETAEQMLVELFLKSDITRANAGRKTLHIHDVMFAKYVTDDMSLLSDAQKYVAELQSVLGEESPMEDVEVL